MSKAAIQAWLDAYNPALHRAIYTTDAMSNIEKLFAEESHIAPSNACITGAGAQAAKSNVDWATNPVLGAINLAQMARTSSGYNPTDLSNAGATNTQYNSFLKKIVTCPLFVVKLSDSLSVTRKSSNWNSLIDAIADTFEGVVDKDRETIVKGLKTLASAASSKMETTQTAATFVQNAINVDGVISLYIYNSETTFYEKKGKGYDMKQNTFKVNRLRLEFQSALWPDWWQKVKKAFDGSVDDWINDNSTSTEKSKTIVAFE